MTWLFSLLASTVFAAETIVSPIPQGYVRQQVEQPKPDKSFTTIAKPVTIGQVLGATTDGEPEIEVVAEKPASKKKSAESSEDIQTHRSTKSRATIAVLGDSMVDTLGPGVPALADRLKRIYPGTQFTILNYGVGATNIDYGIERITNSYSYLGNGVPSLVSQKPDIVVVESFGYNPYSFDEGAIDKHWLAMAKVVDILRSNLPGVKIIIAATIAPNAQLFGDGAPGLSFDPVGKQEKVTVIKKYLENAIKFAQSQKLPLANAYNPSLQSDGNGKPAYINPGDHIHYSDAGRALMAKVIAGAITSHNLLE